TDWRPADKLGLPLIALHKPIHGYEEQLATGVDHFMAKLQPGKAFGRCNWFVSPTDALRWVAEPAEQAFVHVTADNAGETLFVRSERQTLRKLPRTGAVVFTIGVYVAALARLSPANVARIAEAGATLPPSGADRPGARCFRPALQGYAARHGGAIDVAACLFAPTGRARKSPPSSISPSPNSCFAPPKCTGRITARTRCSCARCSASRPAGVRRIAGIARSRFMRTAGWKPPS